MKEKWEEQLEDLMNEIDSQDDFCDIVKITQFFSQKLQEYADQQVNEYADKVIPKLTKKWRGYVETEKKKYAKEIVEEVKPENFMLQEIISATCADFEVPCCAGCPPCDCHTKGTEKNKKWEENKFWYKRGKKVGKIEICNELLDKLKI